MPASTDPDALAPVPAPATPPPDPVKAADGRNRRTLKTLGAVLAFIFILGAAFGIAYLQNPAAFKARSADVGKKITPKLPSGPPLLTKGMGIQNQGFAAAQPAREAPPTVVTYTPPPTAAVPPSEAAAPMIPAAMSAGGRHRVLRDDANTKRGVPAHGIVPSFQAIPCVLVGAVESGRTTGTASANGSRSGGSTSTPIIALVDEDVRTWDTKQIIIPKGTQCCTVGHFEQGRDRIYVDSDFTFILPGKGHSQVPLELVVPGIAEDRQYDARLDTWSLTDLSAGIRGDFIQTRNWDELLLFAAKFVSGASSALSATSPSSFGQAYSNGATSAATGLSGYAINPAVGGAQAVLDQEAQRISDRIEQDGYFLRIPAKKQFYVFVTRGFSLADAVPSDQAAALRTRHEDDLLRQRDERTARARAAEGGGDLRGYGNFPTTASGQGAQLDASALALLAQARAQSGSLRQPLPINAPVRAALPTPVPTPIPYSGDAEDDGLPSR